MHVTGIFQRKAFTKLPNNLVDRMYQTFPHTIYTNLIFREIKVDGIHFPHLVLISIM